MTVKRIRSASRVLDVLEAIARNQPVGLSELARLADTDKSAVQRALTTLDAEGWIRREPGRTGEWRLASRFHAIAQYALCGADLREVVRPVLHHVRDTSGETAALTVLDHDQLIISDVVESRQMLRIAPPAGMTADLSDSASARAIFAWTPMERIRSLLGRTPDAAFMDDLRRTRAAGYSVSESTFDGAVTVAAPIFEGDGVPVAALLLTAPRERLTLERVAEAGALVVNAARSASRGSAAPDVAVAE